MNDTTPLVADAIANYFEDEGVFLQEGKYGTENASESLYTTTVVEVREDE